MKVTKLAVLVTAGISGVVGPLALSPASAEETPPPEQVFELEKVKVESIDPVTGEVLATNVEYRHERLPQPPTTPTARPDAQTEEAYSQAVEEGVQNLSASSSAYAGCYRATATFHDYEKIFDFRIDHYKMHYEKSWCIDVPCPYCGQVNLSARVWHEVWFPWRVGDTRVNRAWFCSDVTSDGAKCVRHTGWRQDEMVAGALGSDVAHEYPLVGIVSGYGGSFDRIIGSK